jgi:hypothetical protein
MERAAKDLMEIGITRRSDFLSEKVVPTDAGAKW